MADYANSQRALISDGRRHDEWMTDAPWYGRGRFVSRMPDNTGMGGTLHTNQVANTADSVDSAGIAWMRTNLRALLDGYATALDEVEAVTRAHASVCKDLAEREQQCEDSARWLEEEKQKVGDLIARQQGHLALISKLSRAARSALIAQVGTLRAEFRASSKEPK